MLNKLKNTDYKKYLEDLRDVRLLGLLIFAAVVLLVTWSGISVIQTNYDLQKKISQLQQEVDIKKLENSNLELRNQYYNTEQYLDLQARRQFGKAAPGEKILLVPRSVALSHSVEPLPEPVPEEKLPEVKPFYQKNFEAWIDFLFRRQQD